MSNLSDDTAGPTHRDGLPPTIDESAITVLQKIGSGGFGIVLRGEWQHNRVALKVFIDVTENKHSELLREGRILWNCEHENIIALYGLCRLSEKGRRDIKKITNVTILETMLVMEYAQGESLWKLVREYQADIQHDVRLDWAKQIASGLTFLHAKNCIHRDLKPDNILIMEPITSSCDLRNVTLKISDFGFVGEDVLESRAPSRRSDAFRWMAPEIYDRPPMCSKKSDVWSYGLVLYFIIDRTLPAFDEAYIPIIPPKEKTGCDIHSKFKNIFEGCFKSNRRDRPEISQILEYLKDIKQSSKPFRISSLDDASSACVPAATQENTARSIPLRAWDHMDKKQLSEKFRKNCSDLVNKLSREEVKGAATTLCSQDMLLQAELEQVHLDGKTATEASRILIDYIGKKDTKEMYCAFLEILHSQLKRDDLVKALTSLEP